MGVPTVFLVGEGRLALVPEYLNLGSVVVIAPDRDTLRRWQVEQEPPVGAHAAAETDATVVDMEGRRILWKGESLPLSELEFKVLGALLRTPGRAWAFRDLRRAGWGDAGDMPVDPYTVKALIQRLRAKLQAADADVTIEAVRGFGFRSATRNTTPTRRDRPVGL
jgi:two-component system, OmpR family, response regulator MtrA